MKKCWCLIILYTFISEPSMARFLLNDADKVDNEEVAGVEYFHDEFSYRPPFWWKKHWRKHQNGIYANVGSLSKNRSIYFEKIKFNSGDEHAATLKFRQNRRHDRFGNLSERNFRLQANQFRPFLFSVLLDSDSEKKLGDGGIALSLEPRHNRLLEVYYWSVDHYYNAKRDIAKNKYTKPTKTYGITYDWAYSRSLRLKHNSEIDTPLVWERLSEGYIYEYERKKHHTAIEYGTIDSGMFYRLSNYIEVKAESKNWLSGDAETQRLKKLNRFVNITELQTNYSLLNGSDFTNGIMFLGRKSFYDWFILDKIELEDYDEGESPDTRRAEQVIYSKYHYFSSPNSGMEYGFIGNNVKIVEDAETERSIETKFLIAWDYIFSNHASMLINVTVDLDDFIKAVTEEKPEFRLYGSWNLQLMAVF